MRIHWLCRLLVDDIPNICIHLGVLSVVTGDKVPFHWTYAEHWVFEEVKALMEEACNHHQVPIQYFKDCQDWCS